MEEERALRRYQEMALRISVFVSKRITKLQQPEESPYGKMPEVINCKGGWEHFNRLNPTALIDEKFKWAETMDTVAKKVTFGLILS